jgi:trimeric autotransporter adhesin
MFSVLPRKWTSAPHRGMSHECQSRPNAPQQKALLFDHLVGNGVTASNTYRMPGIASAASLAAQSGPTSFVTTDATGNLAATNFRPQNIANLNASVTALQQGVNFLQSEVSANQTEARRGVAVAMAANGFTTPVRAGGTTVGVTGGFFKGESAVGFNIAHRFAAWPGLVGCGSIATTGGNETGGRIGASLEF